MKQRLKEIIFRLDQYGTIKGSDIPLVVQILQHYRKGLKIESPEGFISPSLFNDGIRAPDYIKLKQEVDEQFPDLSREERAAIFNSRCKLLQNGTKRPDLIKVDLGANASYEYKFNLFEEVPATKPKKKGKKKRG